MRLSSSNLSNQPLEEEQRSLDSELWHACAGPLVSLPAVGNRVIYFPQGHSEQVAASTNKEIDSQIPNYPSLEPQLICQLHNVTMHADVDTDEVYAQMTLQPLSLVIKSFSHVSFFYFIHIIAFGLIQQEQKEPLLPTELGTPVKQPTNYFCKTLTASDTSTHGGFSVPRRAAEKVFPPLDFTQQPPAQELVARDLHGNEWKFRHIFRGQPKRHLLTTGWSVFVSAKRLVAGDSVLFIWNDNNQLLLGIRRANRPQTVMPSSVLSSDSMHIGLLAAAAHAAATNSRFTIFYNPRASPSEFVIPLAKYVKSVYHTCISVGMRFRMLFETEESTVRRYMGTITGISDLDPARWPNSHWRSVKVGWDESAAGERHPRVSLWEIEPLTTFPMYPSPFPLRLKRPWPAGLPSLHGLKDEGFGLNSPLMWLRDGGSPAVQSLNFQGVGVTPWLQPRLDASILGLQPDMYQTMAAAALQEMRTIDAAKQVSPTILQFQQPHNIAGRATSISASQILQNLQPLSQQNFLQSVQGNQVHSQNQSQLLQHNHQHTQSFAEKQQAKQIQHQPQSQQSLPQQPPPQQHQQQPQHIAQQQQLQSPQNQQILQQKLLPNHQVPNVLSASLGPSSQSQSTTVQTATSFCLPRNFPDSNGNFISASGVSPLHNILHQLSSEETSHLFGMPRTVPAVTSNPWSPKHLTVESVLPSRAQCILPQVEQLGTAQTNIPQQSIMLPPFPGSECLVASNNDPQNHLLFGVNIDTSTLLGHNGIPNLSTVVSETDVMSMPYAACNFVNSADNEFPLNHTLTVSSSLDDSGYLSSPGNVDQVNPQSGTFVKIYKSGSLVRSLDITRFSSYHELRSELGRLFGLEGQLEDPLRSGWQLVFVDRENDILLLGDDPWHEFVNNVSCIKILSPEEVQQMGKQGLEFLNSTPITTRLPNNSCEDYIGRQDPASLGTRIASVGALEY